MILPAVTVPKKLSKQVGRAIYDFNMLKDGDRVLLAVSGGKDSLSLFHILQHFKKCAPIKFHLGVVSIDPKVTSFDLSPLLEYFASYGVDYFLEQFPIVEQAKKSMKGNSYCAFCARMKRGLMYKIARKHNYNILALGQHLDDLAQSLIMSIFHNGQLQTMKANYLNNDGDINVIRPLIYVRERQLVSFANTAKLPIIKDNCPACFAKPTQREYYKNLLNKEESRVANLYANILNAIKPILTTNKTT